MILVTGASAVGKTTLINHSVAAHDARRLSAVTTRTARCHEGEPHRTVTRTAFDALRASGGLVLASCNHGEWYGYSTSDFEANDERPVLIEVDFDTALRERDAGQFSQVILVIPGPHVRMETLIAIKGDGVESRVAEYLRLTSDGVVDAATQRGWIVFQNNHDDESVARFLSTVRRTAAGGVAG